jgi:hypothetical protein
MVKEASMTGCVWRRPLRSVPEKAQRGQRTLDRLCARHERALDRDGITGKGKADTSDAGRDIVRCGVVGNQPVLWVRFLPEISEGIPLERVKLILAIRWSGIPGGALLRAHAGVSSTVRATTL